MLGKTPDQLWSKSAQLLYACLCGVPPRLPIWATELAPSADDFPEIKHIAPISASTIVREVVVLR